MDDFQELYQQLLQRFEHARAEIEHLTTERETARQQAQESRRDAEEARAQATAAQEAANLAMEFQRNAYQPLIKELFEEPMKSLEKHIRDSGDKSRNSLEKHIRDSGDKSRNRTIVFWILSLLSSIGITYLSVQYTQSQSKAQNVILTNNIDEIAINAKKITTQTQKIGNNTSLVLTEITEAEKNIKENISIKINELMQGTISRVYTKNKSITKNNNITKPIYHEFFAKAGKIDVLLYVTNNNYSPSENPIDLDFIIIDPKGKEIESSKSVQSNPYFEVNQQISISSPGRYKIKIWDGSITNGNTSNTSADNFQYTLTIYQ